MKKTIALILALLLTLSLCACSVVNERYVALIECLDRHDYDGAYGQIGMLRQQAIENGDIVIVEPQNEDYELVNRYQGIADFLANYSPYSYNSIYDPTADQWIDGNEALAYCYAQLQILEGVDKWLDSEYFTFEEGFPTDRAALLSRFAMVENKPLNTSRTAVDNMGNENDWDGTSWFYDENGVVLVEYISPYDAEALWEGLFTNSGYYRYTYNDAGVITETRITDRENENVYAVIVPTYDASGNLISETITTNNGEYNFSYTYDSNGNRAQMDYSSKWDDYSVVYAYNDQGKLIQKDRYRYDYQNETQIVDTQKTTVYTYDASGKLISADITTQDFGWRYSSAGFETFQHSEKKDSVSYSYNTDGLLSQEVWKFGETVNKNNEVTKPQYTTQIIDYFYGDYYIFN